MERMEMTVGDIADMEEAGGGLTPVLPEYAVAEQCAAIVTKWRARVSRCLRCFAEIEKHLPPPSNEPPLDAERITQLLKG